MVTKQHLLDHWQMNKIITDERVLEAFKEVPREDFVLPSMQSIAYADRALPYLCSQTVSQPSTVVIMLQALELKPNHTVLEIGTGSGYNAALLSKLAKSVYSVEIVHELLGPAKKNLEGYAVYVLEGNGAKGLIEKAPFDRIIVTCACSENPLKLFSQLKENGVIVAPVGLGVQHMLKFRKKEGNVVLEEDLGEYVFVAMKG